MIWLALLAVLLSAGLPWFAALAGVVIIFQLHVGLEPAVVMLEVDRVREFRGLAALALLMFCGRVLSATGADQSRPGETRKENPPARRWRETARSLVQLPVSAWTRPGFLEPGIQSARLALTTDRHFRTQPSASWGPDPALAVILLVPSVSLVLFGLMFQVLMPTRAPELQTLFLAGLIPALLLFLISSASDGYGSNLADEQNGRSGGASTGEKLFLLGLSAGLYLGLWGVFEAAATAAIGLSLYHGLGGRMSIRTLQQAALQALVPFGAVALVFGLSLAWTSMVGDAGLNPAEWRTAEPASTGAGMALALAAAAIWSIAAALLRPLPALIVGTPLIVPGMMLGGLPAEQLAVLGVLGLHTGSVLASAWHKASSLRAALGALTPVLLVILAVSAWPALSLWLPGMLRT